MNLLMVLDVSGTTTSVLLRVIQEGQWDAQVVTCLVQWMAYTGSAILFYLASRVISLKK